ncbi:MAG: zf-HC2 domain-containing protein [Deltaproteobacteria bacterium]|nr:zf-HC2 domain-containing protein [Deltaproteobacteria bacterium]
MQCENAQELITALVDNELTLEERGAIEGHLGECGKCRWHREQESLLKQQIKLASAAVTAPAGLRARVQEDIRKLSAKARPERSHWLQRWLQTPALRPAFGLMLLALVIVPLAYQWWPAKTVALAALETHENIVAGEKAFKRSSDPVELKRQLVQAVGNRFAPMGYDLSGMKVYPVGGFVEKIAGRDVLVTVYQGDGHAVTCFTFLGTEADAPKGAQLAHDPGKRMNFYTFSHGDLHGVLHREGEVICIMVSKMPMAELLAMVREKARAA